MCFRFHVIVIKFLLSDIIGNFFAGILGIAFYSPIVFVAISKVGSFKIENWDELELFAR